MKISDQGCSHEENDPAGKGVIKYKNIIFFGVRVWTVWDITSYAVWMYYGKGYFAHTKEVKFHSDELRDC